MKKPILFLFTYLFLAQVVVQAQHDWQPGYILKSDGSKQEGLIDLRNSKSNSGVCYFRASAASKTESYTPNKLTAYRFTDGKYFISRSLPEFELNEPVFLELLIEGKLNVYHYLETSIDRYFVEKDGTVYELENTEKIIFRGSDKLEIERKEYIGLLNILLQDANMQEEISKSKMTPKSLVEIAKTYHNIVCTEEECIIYELGFLPKKIAISPFAGFTYNKVNFGSQIHSSYDPAWTAGVRFSFQNLFTWAQQLSLELDLAVQSFGSYTLRIKDGKNVPVYNEGELFYIRETANSISVETLDVNIDALFLKVPVIVRHDFSPGKLQPFVGVGFMNIFTLSQGTTFEHPEFIEAFGQTVPPYFLGFTGQLGCRYQMNSGQAFWVQLADEYCVNPHSYGLLRMRSNLLSLSAGFQF